MGEIIKVGSYLLERVGPTPLEKLRAMKRKRAEDRMRGSLANRELRRKDAEEKALRDVERSLFG